METATGRMTSMYLDTNLEYIFGLTNRDGIRNHLSQHMRYRIRTHCIKHTRDRIRTRLSQHTSRAYDPVPEIIFRMRTLGKFGMYPYLPKTDTVPSKITVQIFPFGR